MALENGNCTHISNRKWKKKKTAHRMLQIIEIKVKKLQSPCKPLNTCFFTLFITYAPSNTCAETDYSSVKMWYNFLPQFPWTNVEVITCNSNLFWKQTWRINFMNWGRSAITGYWKQNEWMENSLRFSLKNLLNV
jgi:hypothetical protein